MQDNALIAIIISTLVAGEATAGIPGTPIKQAFQPTAQGANTQPTAYIHKLFDKRYGFLGRSDVWNSTQMVHTETQQYETTFQLSVLATQNPQTPSQYTASDICNLCASILQSSVSVASLQAQSVGIERITDVRNPYFLDDREQFEASPSFDFCLTHKQILSSTTPILESEELAIYPV